MSLTETFKEDVECILHKAYRCSITALVYELIKDSPYRGEFLGIHKSMENVEKKVSLFDDLFAKGDIVTGGT